MSKKYRRLRREIEELSDARYDQVGAEAKFERVPYRDQLAAEQVAREEVEKAEKSRGHCGE